MTLSNLNSQEISHDVKKKPRPISNTVAMASRHVCWFQLWSCIWEKGEDIDLGVSLQSRVADVAGWMFANFLKTPQDSVNTDVFKSCITHKLLMMNSLVVMHLWNKLKRGFLHYTNVHLKPLSANPRLYKHICEHAFAVMDTSAAQTYCMIILGSVNLCGSAKGEHGRRDKNCSLSLRQSVSKHWTSVQRQKKATMTEKKKKGSSSSGIAVLTTFQELI